jgi:hypothetical protein
MNALVTFRLCTLTDKELLDKVDAMTDKMYDSQKVPTRHIPARPNDDYDLLVGEVIHRYNEIVSKEPDDKPCLSLNDVKSCCHDDSAGGGCLYLNEEKLKEIVRERCQDLQ